MVDSHIDEIEIKVLHASWASEFSHSLGHSPQGRVGSKSGDVRYCAESGSKFRALAAARWVMAG